MVLLLASVSAVLFISAICSLFEAVLYSVPSSHVEAMAHQGRSAGRILQKLRDTRYVDRPISAILSLNTLANTGGATLAGIAFVQVYHDVPEGYFTLFITMAVLIFSEVIPKTIGVVYSRPISGYIARPLLILTWVMMPLIVLCRVATKAVSKGRDQDDVSGDDLVVMARLSLRTGAIDHNEAGVIQNIVLLKSRTAHDVMTPRTVVFSLSDKLTIGEASEQAGSWPHSRVPVYEDDFEDIVGIVIRRDALHAIAGDREDTRLSEIMRPVHFVSESTSLDRILQMFLERRQHLFVVIDEYGGLSGVITLEDILEEILGHEIVDEFDEVADMRELARRRRQQVTRPYQHPPAG